MKTKIAYIIILAMIYSMQINFAQEKLSTKSVMENFKSKLLSNESYLQCPVQTPENPNPPNNAVNIPTYGCTLSWSNGGPGTVPPTQVEVQFGPTGNMSTVYYGVPITSWDVPGALNYFTNYQWRVINKIDTCSISETWSFLTIQDPNFVGWYEPFANLSNWTTVGPMGMTNWSVMNSNYSGGNAPELQFSWSPSFNGESKIRSVYIPILAHQCCLFSFKFYLDWYANPSGTISIGLTYDGGASSILLYVLENPTGSVGPLNITKTFGTQSTNPPYPQIEITYIGYSFNIDYIYWDDISFDYLLSDMCPPGAPGNLTAQIIFDPNLQVQLGWQDYTWNEDGFKVLRKNGQPGDPGNYILVGTVGQNQIQYIDDTVLPESTYTYKVFAYNQYGQNSSNTTTIAVPVPVELISFTTEVNDNFVTLFWQTATETNNSGFEIERKKSEVRSQESEWKRIGFVEGKGTTTEMQNYSFTDKPEAGIYKYRLKQIDYDGTIAYSSEIEAEVKVPNVFSLEQNYPNPFNPSTVIRYQLPVSSDVTLKVYDILGKEVVTLVDEYKPAGKYEVEFNALSSFRLVRNLTSGTYFYQLQAGSFIETKKMSLLK